MKEDEAKNKWCPQVRFHSGCNFGVWDNKPGDREQASKTSTFSIASNCMMWRWEVLYDAMPFSGQIVENGRSATEGYCGLAGKP